MENNIVEQTQEWDQLTEALQKIVVEVHRGIIPTDLHTLMRIFNLGRPVIVLGFDGRSLKQCRIHETSVDVMKVLVKNYAV